MQQLYNFSNHVAPTITTDIDIQGLPMIPVIGSNYSLSCLVSRVAESLESHKTYQWKKGNTIILTATTMEVFNFLPLTASHAGRYTCMVTVESAYLNGNIIALSPYHDLNLRCRSS